MSASGLPPGVTAQFSPNPATDGSTLTLEADDLAALGSAYVTITGTGGGLTRAVIMRITVKEEGQAEGIWPILTKPWVQTEIGK